MELGLDQQQAAVDELCTDFFGRECPPEVTRQAEPLGFSAAVWQRLRETGLVSMAIAGRHGGGGAGLLDMSIAAEHAGRTVAPVPLIDHVVATRVLAAARDSVPLPDETWSAVLDGTEIAALALRPLRDGVARIVPAGAVARHVIAYDHERDELALYDGVPPETALANLASSPVADRRVVADGGRRTVLAHGDAARSIWSSGVDEWRLLTASALVGLSETALALGVEYVKQRHQFGVPIGSFQAVQHGFAELPGRIAGARLLVMRAAWGVDGGTTDDPSQTDRSRQAPMALLFAAELAGDVTSRVVHYHGGYGVMEEQDAQLYYRRAKGWPQLLAEPGREIQHLADVVLGPVGRR